MFINTDALGFGAQLQNGQGTIVWSTNAHHADQLVQMPPQQFVSALQSAFAAPVRASGPLSGSCLWCVALCFVL